MAIQIADGFQLRVAKPLDDRQNVETVAQLDPTYGYEGQIVYVKDVKQFYTCYKDENGSLAYKVMENGGGGSSEEQIKDWVSGSSYLEGDYVYHEGEIYRCLTSNSDVDFDEANWIQVTYGIDELSKEDVERLLGLTEEEIEAMEGLILDTEVRIDKTYSSSKIYTDIQQCLEDSKTYTLEEIAKIGTASYKIVTDVADMTEERYLYLLHDGATNYDIYVVEADGTPTKIGSTQIDLSSYYTKEEVDELLEANAVDLSGYAKTFTSLSELGLTAPVSIGEAFNAMPDKTMLMLNVNNVSDGDATVTDAPHNQGVLVINKHNNGRFSIEFNYSLGGNGNTIRKWIGTLKGSDGTGLNWKEVAYLNDHAMKSYSSLSDLGLDTTATINDIVGKMANTSMLVYKTDVFDLTQYENLQFATVTIIKQSANRVQAIMTDKDTGNLYVGRMDSANKINGWQKVCTTTAKDVPLTTITTSNLSSDKITAGVVSYCVKNGVCYVYLEGINCSEVSTNVSILENMPKALITSGAHAVKSSSDATSTQYCFITKNETTLKLHCFKARDTGYCSFSYPVAE